MVVSEVFTRHEVATIRLTEDLKITPPSQTSLLIKLTTTLLIIVAKGGELLPALLKAHSFEANGSTVHS